MEELRTEYLESFDEKFTLWGELFSQKDWYSLELEFHKMKGTGTTYGAPEVTELCKEMERICRESDELPRDLLDAAIGLLTQIRDKYLNQKDFELADHPDFVSIKSK